MYYITDLCDGCGLCAQSCPLDIIWSNDHRYEIGIGCNSCGICSGVCPVGAIKKS